jgi:hypothetical protein
MRFPKLVRKSPQHQRERGEGSNGGQGFPKVVHTLGCQARAMGCHGSATSPTLFPCRADAGTHNARSPELDERRSARPSSILTAGSSSLSLERLRYGGVLATLALGRGSVKLRSRCLCDTHGGRSRGMPNRLLSLLPCQSNGVGTHCPSPGKAARQAAPSPPSGMAKGSGEMELSMKQRLMESTKTNTTPLSGAPDVAGAFTDTGGNTP